MTKIFKCPECGTEGATEDSYTENVITCPNCGDEAQYVDITK